MVCLLPGHSCCLCQPVVHKHPTQQCHLEQPYLGDALLDLYLMLSKARSSLYLFDEVVGFMEKHAGHTFQKGVTLPRRETLIK
jgi:hypothetical protein